MATFALAQPTALPPRLGLPPNENDMNDNNKPFFQYHVFFCANMRDSNDARPSCGRCDAEGAQQHAKRRIKELGMSAPGKVRINKVNCLDRCEEGPVLVVYPEGTWYTYVDTTDIDDIVDSHLIGGKVVDRLKI